MLKEEDAKKIEKGMRGDLVGDIFLVIFAYVVIIFLCYLLFSLESLRELRPSASILLIIFLLFLMSLPSISRLVFKGVITTTVEGVIIPQSKKLKTTLIKYSEIELVVIEVTRNMSPRPIYIFFERNDKKYFYIGLQIELENYRQFITDLEERGVKVDILDESWFKKYTHPSNIRSFFEGRKAA